MRLLSAVLLVGLPGRAAFAQGLDPVFQPTGFQQYRSYISSETNDFIDTMSGGLTLTATDLMLPGNGGVDLRFTRAYNSNNGFWTFGIAGMVMYVHDPQLIGDPTNPSLILGEGGSNPTFIDAPGTPYRWFHTTNFWKYDRQTRTLYFPNGVINSFDSLGRLIEIQDAFGNTTSLSWTTDSHHLTVLQNLWNGQQRTVEIEMNGTAPSGARPFGFPSSMSYDGKIWQYDGGPKVARVTLPQGGVWTYGYTDLDGLTTVLHPSGARIDYVFDHKSFARNDINNNPLEFLTQVVVAKEVNGNHDLRWTYDYQEQSDFDILTSVTTPDGARTEYLSSPLDQYQGALKHRYVYPAGSSSPVETEVLDYTLVRMPYANDGPSFGPELHSRQIGLDGKTYTTTYTYGSDATYGDYHQPYEITETSSQPGALDDRRH